MVQTRWGHINPGISLLTRAQAIAIDTHFAVDQVARFGKNLFFNFNGTAGVWRKHCIIDAGNWQDDTLTEDLDLSYHARLRGWKFLYNKDIVNPAELPIWVNSYKSQQFRWAKGSIQTAMKLAGSILKSKIPLFVKFQAFMHLTYYSVHLFLIVNILFLLPILGMDNLLWNSNFLLLYGFLFTPVLIVAAPAVCLYSQYKFYPDWKTKMLWIPSIMLAGTGNAVNNSKAFLEAIFKKQSQFIRTPKTGIQNKKENWKNKKYLPPWSFLSLLEFGLILYIVLAITYAFRLKNMYLIPILFFYLSAFGYIFFLEIIQHIQMRSRL